MIDALIAVVTGAASGVFAGLLGVGGGVVMIPVMVLVLDRTQLLAQGTSLAVIVPTAIVAALAYSRRGLVDTVAATRVAMGGFAGAVAGALVATRVIADDQTLRRAFGVWLVLVAVRLIVSPVRRNAGQDG